MNSTDNTSKQICNDADLQILKPFSTFPKSKPNQFSIVSWNTLIKTDNNNNTSEYCNWNYRLSFIHKTLKHFNSDVICLQEAHLSSFNNDFNTFCDQNQYEYKLNNYNKLNHDKKQNKNDKNDKKECDYEMTTVILWKTNKFKYKYHDFRTKATIVLLELIDDKKENKIINQKTKTKKQKKSKKSKKQKAPTAIDLWIAKTNVSRSDITTKWNLLSEIEKNIYISEARKLKKKRKNNQNNIKIPKMKLDSTKSYIWIINVHLEAHGNYEKQLNKSEMRYNQIRHAIERIVNYMEGECLINDVNNINCVFCGDFNDVNDSKIDRMLRNKLNINDNNNFINKLKLFNAYNNILNYNRRKEIISHWITNRQIDHFYYTYNNLKCILLMETVPNFMKLIDNNKLNQVVYPNKDIISDHLPIASMYQFIQKPSNNNNINGNRKRSFSMMSNETENDNYDIVLQPATKKIKLDHLNVSNHDVQQ